MMVVRNCLFSQEKYSTNPNNLKARNSSRYNGLIDHKTVGMEPATNSKGRGGHEAEIWPAKASHFLRMDHQECSGHAQQHQAHNLEEQVPPGSVQAAFPRTSAILRSQSLWE
jgi:hypothetical protein